MTGNHYLDVLLEAAWAASVVPFSSEATIAAMKSFGGFHMPLALLLAATGAIAGQFLNYFLGCLLAAAREKNYIKIPAGQYEKSRALFGRYGLWLLFFCWAPILNFLVVAAGFFGIRAAIALPLIAVGEMAYYGSLLM